MKTIDRRIALTATGMAMGLAFAAASAAGTGHRAGSWLLSPYVELDGAYDSNVYKSGEKEVSDFYLEPEIGLRFSSSTETNLFTASGNVFGSRREYASEGGLGFNTFGDHVGLRYGHEDRMRLEAVQSFRRIRDNDRHASDIENSSLSSGMLQDIHSLSARRDVHQAGATAGWRVSDRSDLTVAYRLAATRYDEEGFFDLTAHLAQADLARKLTDKTATFVTLRHGIQSQENVDGDAALSTARLGLLTRGTDKLYARLGAGVEHYELPPDSREDAIDSFNFDAALDWIATDKLLLRAGGYNGTQLSSLYRGNAIEFISGWLGAGWRWSPTTTLSLRAIYREDEYVDPVSVNEQPVQREDDRYEAQARIDWSDIGGRFKVYAGYSHDLVESNVRVVEYTDHRVIVGAGIRY